MHLTTVNLPASKTLHF